MIAHVVNPAGHRRAIDMNVEGRQKDADTRHRVGEQAIAMDRRDGDNPAVGGRNHQAVAGGDLAFRIAKEMPRSASVSSAKAMPANCQRTSNASNVSAAAERINGQPSFAIRIVRGLERVITHQVNSLILTSVDQAVLAQPRHHRTQTGADFFQRMIGLFFSELAKVRRSRLKLVDPLVGELTGLNVL